MCIDKTIAIQLLSLVGCNFKQVGKTRVIYLSIYKNNKEIGSLMNHGMTLRVNHREQYFEYESCEYNDFVKVINNNKLG